MRTISIRLWATGLAVLALHAAGIGEESEYDYEPPIPGTYALPVIREAADGALLDSSGQPVYLRDLARGRVTVLSFIYTRCAAARACPYATGVLNDLHETSAENEALAKNLRLVSMSFDPDFDTPERMAAYAQIARDRKSGSEWRFVTARSRADLRGILDAYGQAVDRKRNATDPTGPLNHTLRVFLVDREGQIRNIYSSGTLDSRLVLADVQTLMMEQGAFASR